MEFLNTLKRNRPDIASHIFHEGILGNLLKRRRTVVMVTDREDFLQRADKVL